MSKRLAVEARLYYDGTHEDFVQRIYLTLRDRFRVLQLQERNRCIRAVCGECGRALKDADKAERRAAG